MAIYGGGASIHSMSSLSWAMDVHVLGGGGVCIVLTIPGL